MVAGLGPEHGGTKALAAIVFTDVVGFSQKSQQNEAVTLASLQRDLGLMGSICNRFNGSVLKTLGDGILMRFTSAQNAVDAALEIQRTLFRQSRVLNTNEILEHRIGIHLGDVIVTKDDVMGDGVNIAARLQALAHPGAICLSRTVYDVAKGKILIPAKYLGPRTLKGIKDPIMVWEIPPIKDLEKEKQESALEAFVVPQLANNEGATGVKAAIMLALLALVIAGGAVVFVIVFKDAQAVQKLNTAKEKQVPHGPTLLDRLRAKENSTNPPQPDASHSGSAANTSGTGSGTPSQNQTGANGSTFSGQTPDPALLATLKPLYDACQFAAIAQTVGSSTFGQTPSGMKMKADNLNIADAYSWLKSALSRTSETSPLLVSGFPNTSSPVQVYQQADGKVVVNLGASPLISELHSLPKSALSAISISAADDPETQQGVPNSLLATLKSMVEEGKLFGEN